MFMLAVPSLVKLQPCADTAQGKTPFSLKSIKKFDGKPMLGSFLVWHLQGAARDFSRRGFWGISCGFRDAWRAVMASASGGISPGFGLRTPSDSHETRSCSKAGALARRVT